MNRIHEDKAFVLEGEDGLQLKVRYSNMGEPWREGITIALENHDYTLDAQVFLHNQEGRALRDWLIEFYKEDD